MKRNTVWLSVFTIAIVLVAAAAVVYLRQV